MIINLYKLIKHIYTILYCLFKNTLIIFVINSLLYAQNKSYFFTNEQSNAILDKLNNHKVKKKRNKRKPIEYKLSGICYLSTDNWVVWINGQSYNRIGQYSQFSIDEVTPDSVTITTLDCKTIHLTVKCDNTITMSRNTGNSNINNTNYNNVMTDNANNQTVNNENNMPNNTNITTNENNSNYNTNNNTSMANNNTTQNNNISTINNNTENSNNASTNNNNNIVNMNSNNLNNNINNTNSGNQTNN